MDKNTIGIIEIGTNSIKYLASFKDDGGIKYLYDENDVTRIGAGLSGSKIISNEAMERNLDSIVRHMDLFKTLDVQKTILVGTMGLRMANNSQEFARKVKEKAGLDLIILSGEDEAKYTFKGMLKEINLKEGTACFVDVGGGSTEFIFTDNSSKDNAMRCYSLPFGAVSLNEKFNLSLNPSNVGHAETYLREALKKEIPDDIGSTTSLVGTGGTLAALVSVAHKKPVQTLKKERENGKDLILSKGEIGSQIELFSSIGVEAIQDLPCMDPKRADIILAGACITQQIMKFFNANQIKLSVHALRHALADVIFAGDKIME